MFYFLKNLFNRTPFALYISDNKVRAMQLNQDGALGSVGEMDLPEGTIVKGEIANEKIFSETVVDMLSKAKPARISQNKCIVTIPELQTYEHIFHLPMEMKGELLKSAIFGKISGMIPIPLEEVIFEMANYLVGQIQVVLTVVARKPILQSYYRVLKDKCGISPIVFEPESLSLLRNVPINMDPNKGTLLIYTNDTSVKWFSIWSGLVFDSNIITAKEDANIHEELIQDIKDSCEFYATSTKQEIGNIYLVGRKENVASLAQILKQQIKIPVSEIGRYKVNMVAGENQDPGQFCIVGGAALRAIQGNDNNSINLLKK